MYKKLLSFFADGYVKKMHWKYVYILVTTDNNYSSNIINELCDLTLLVHHS